jgi:hypothetical protein
MISNSDYGLRPRIEGNNIPQHNKKNRISPCDIKNYIKESIFYISGKIKSLFNYIITKITRIKNKILGYLILPSQSLYNHQKLNSNLDTRLFDYVDNFKKIQINENGIKLNIIICSPSDREDKNNNRCSILCNPNASTAYHFAAEIVDPPGMKSRPSIASAIFEKGTVILWDYPNTGINCDINEENVVAEDQIINSAEAVIQYANKNYDNVDILGLSLGGGVATVSLERFLTKNKDVDHSKFQVAVFNSFTTIPSVVLPDSFKISSFLGWLVGVGMDSETAVKYLISHNICTIIYNNSNDNVIPARARLASSVESNDQNNENLFVFTELSRRYRHMDFGDNAYKMLSHLEQKYLIQDKSNEDVIDASF